MTDIERIQHRIKVLDDEIQARQVEKDELETAARVLRRLARADTDGRAGGRRKGKRRGNKPTIMDMAKAILADKGEAYYKDIADEALQRGYQGQRGSKPDRIRQSFWAILKRNRDAFVPLGGGKFKLKTEEPSTP